MVRVGVIGASGNWGSKLVSKLKEIESQEELKGKIKCYPLSWDRKTTVWENANFIKDQKMDWVIVATPPNTHYAITRSCLMVGLNVFLEKPATGNVHRLRELIAIAKTNGLKLYIDDVFTYHDSLFKSEITQEGNKRIVANQLHQIKQAQKPVRNGKTKIKRFDLSWVKDGNIQYDIHDTLTYHDINLLLYLDIPPKFFSDKNLKVCEYDQWGANIIYEDNQDIVKIHIDRSVTQFSPKIGKKINYYSYSNGLNNNIHNHEYNFKILKPIDPLKIMLTETFIIGHTKSQIDTNHQRAIDTLDILNNIKKYKMEATRNKKIAIVGGGIFGCTIAWMLGTQGYEVDLYEQGSKLLPSTSAKNQFRSHMGYHYPRSKETAMSCRIGTESFETLFKDCIIRDTAQHYCIAKSDSMVTNVEFREFMNDCGLPYKPVNTQLNTLNRPNCVSHSYTVPENLFSPHKIRRKLTKELDNLDNVNVLLKRKFHIEYKGNYTNVINCTYKDTNKYRNIKLPLQYELCEKPIVRLAPKYGGMGIVLMDGNFTCIDPYVSKYHAVGNVKYAIHRSSFEPFTSAELKDYEILLNEEGVCPVGGDRVGKALNKITNIELFKRDLEKYLGIKESEIEHIGSMFTTRTVLSGREHDDARPTLVQQDGNLIHVFSGKIATCVEAGRAVLNKLEASNIPQKTKYNQTNN